MKKFKSLLFTLSFALAALTAHSAGPLLWGPGQSNLLQDKICFPNSSCIDGSPVGTSITNLTGDVTASGPGSVPALIEKLQGYTLDLGTPPADNQVLTYSSSAAKWIAADAQAPIVGTPMRYAYFNSSSSIATLPGWTVQDWYGPNANLSITAPADAGDVNPGMFYTELEVDPGAVSTTQFHPSGVAINGHFDRTGSGTDMNDLTWLKYAFTYEGNGTIQNYTDFSLVGGLGNNLGGHAVTYTHMATGVNIENNFTADLVNGITHNMNIIPGSNVTNVNVSSLNMGGPMTGNLNGLLLTVNPDGASSSNVLNVGQQGTITGNSQIISAGSTANTGGISGVSVNIQGSHTGQVNGLVIGMDNPTNTGKTGIALNLTNNGEISSGQGRFMELNAGDGTFTGFIGLNLNHGSINPGANETAINIGKSGNATTDYTGINFPANGPATNSWTSMLLSGSPTGSIASYKGIQISPHDFTATTSAQGLSINMSGVDSVVQKQGLSVEDGSTFAFSNYDTGTYPASPGFFQHNFIGGNLHVSAGFPMSGTYGFGNNLGISIFAEDDVGADPTGFHLGFNDNGFATNVAVVSGKTVDAVTMMLAGAGVPAESTGGTITYMTMFRALGLLPSGGTIAATNMYGFKVDSLLCSSATNCWGNYVEDSSADNFFSKSITIGGSTQKSDAGVGLELAGGKHLRSTGDAPVATVNSNAGTGATCDVANATDTAGLINLTTTAVAPSAGVQCSIAFDVSYNTAPICVITPTNAPAGQFGPANGVYVTTTTGQMDLRYAVADAVGHGNSWSYHCIETQ